MKKGRSSGTSGDAETAIPITNERWIYGQNLNHGLAVTRRDGLLSVTVIGTIIEKKYAALIASSPELLAMVDRFVEMMERDSFGGQEVEDLLDEAHVLMDRARMIYKD